MKRACIVTADAARARICLYQEQAKPGFELTEYKDLDNPGRRLKPSEMVSARSDQAPGTGAAKDDHRFAHIDELDAKFAKLIIETLDHVLHSKQMSHLIVIAPPKMLGVLRDAGLPAGPEVSVDEVAADLSKATLAQLHDQLALRGLVPARARLAAAR